jgi:hypothetical protein
MNPNETHVERMVPTMHQDIYVSDVAWDVLQVHHAACDRACDDSTITAVKHGRAQPMYLRERAGERRVDPRHNHLPSAPGAEVVTNCVCAGPNGKGLATRDESILVVG